MKKSVLVLALLLFYFLPKAQTMNDNNLEKRLSEIEDRIAIKNLVDTFSILPDQKETQKANAAFYRRCKFSNLYQWSTGFDVERTKTNRRCVCKFPKQL